MPDPVAFVLAAHVSMRLHAMTLVLSLYAIRRYHPSATIVIVDNGSPLPITLDALPFRERVHVERNSPQQIRRREYGAYGAGLLALHALPGGLKQWKHVVFMQAALIIGQPVPALAEGCPIQPLSSLAPHRSAPAFQTSWFMKRRATLEAFLNISRLELGDLRTERLPYVLHNSFAATHEGARLILNASGAGEAAPLLGRLPLSPINLGDKQNGEKFGGVLVDRISKRVAALDPSQVARRGGASCVANLRWKPLHGGWQDATWLPGSGRSESLVQTGPKVGFWKVHGSGIEGHPVGFLALMRLADADEDGLLTRSELVAMASADALAGSGRRVAGGSGAAASGSATWPLLWRATCLTLPYQRDGPARRAIEGLRQPSPSRVVRCLAALLDRRDGGAECSWPPPPPPASSSATATAAAAAATSTFPDNHDDAQQGCASCDSEASARWWGRQALDAMAALPTSLLSPPPQRWVEALYGGLTQPLVSGERYWGTPPRGGGGGWLETPRRRDGKAVQSGGIAAAAAASTSTSDGASGADAEPASKPEHHAQRQRRRQFAADLADAVLALADDDGDGRVSFNDLARMTEPADEPSTSSSAAVAASLVAAPAAAPISSTLLPLCWRAEAAGLLSLGALHAPGGGSGGKRGGGGGGGSSKGGGGGGGKGAGGDVGGGGGGTQGSSNVAVAHGGNASVPASVPDAARDYHQRLWMLQHPPKPFVSWDEPVLAHGSLSVALNTAALVLARRALCCLQRHSS